MGALWATWLPDVARIAVAGTPYQVVTVDGWQNRGHGGFQAFEGVVGHHTGTASSAQGDYPTLKIVRDGRSDLAGPLCNYGLGRSGSIYIVAAGVAWHAGASAYAGMVDLNDEFLGIEAESPGNLWTPAQLDCYPRLVRAILDFIRRPMNRYCSHRTCATPAGRKNDPAGISDAWMQNQAAGAHPNPLPAPTGATTAHLEEPVADIPLTMFSDGSFRGGVMCEAGNNSLVVKDGYITFGVLWGGRADFTISFLAGGGVMGQLKRTIRNNGDGSVPIPTGCRMVTVEGKAVNDGGQGDPNVVPAAARVLIPR